jgi:hypothetical protein
MEARTEKRWIMGFAVLLAVLTCVGAAAISLPDPKLNPSGNAIEIAESVWNGTNFDVRLVVFSLGEGIPSQVTSLSGHPADDLDPRMVIGADGSADVVWWRDGATDEVVARRRSAADRTWSAERRLTDPFQDARNPSIAKFWGTLWVAFERSSAYGTEIVVGVINDEPDPIACDVLATTSFAGRVEVRIHALGGHLWVSWIDGPADLGWSEFDPASATWSAPQFEPLTGGVQAARDRVRDQVTGN